ncbi:hypothetical protein SI65_00819 [Aspergillus cristatus]|uniref:Uncharacterized protein n=1 Tax=Aspergillus cristatus TaxID=573508 RepID=A0A1E3BQK0_ASPCR|nr:hypothetical protein SI65_00819 [Aspergillus cristatus]
MESRPLKTKNASDLFHRGPADFNNLEIRSTWSGKVDEPADLQISLHVICTPNTQLPLLNLQPSYISLVKTSVRCLASGSDNGESRETPPRSPLFAFSAPVSDDDDGGEGSVYDECWDKDAPSGLSVIPEEDEFFEMELPEPESLDEDRGLDEEPPVSVSAPIISSTDGSVSETGLSELGLTPYPEDAGESGESGEHTVQREQESEKRDRRDSALSLFQLSPLSGYPPELPYEDFTFSQSLGKRSATDACLSDHEQDMEEKRTHRRNVSTHSSGSVCSTGIDFATLTGEIELQTRHTSDSIEGGPGRHSNRPSLIPERVSMGGLPPEQQQHSEVDNSHQEETEVEDNSQEKEESTDSIEKSIPDTSVPEAVAAGDVGAQLIVEELDAQTKIASDELLISSDTDEDTLSESEEYDPELGSPTPVKPSNPVIPPTPTSLTDTVAYDGVTSHAKTEKDVEEVLQTPKAASNGPPGAKGTPTKDEEDDDPGSPTPVRPTRLIIPPTKALVNEDTKSPSMPSSTDVAYPESESFQHVTSEPELDLNDGILLVSNPPQANYLTYKISITVSVRLQKGKLHGWHNLVIPGLPRVRNGESGYLIFLLPDSCGMEFRTTNFRRNKFVENCFFAEFAISGDLVIPLRVCDLRSYGIVKDFTVDYELLTDHDVLNGNKVSVAYNAVCELKLPNRRIWADKCCFFLDIEGGPEGFYQYELDQPCTKFPIIYLASWDRPVGVAHVQVTCPLKILEMFCITWDVKDLTRLETKWIPRIYPGSTGVNGQERQSLRKKFVDALGAANCYEFVEAEYDDTDMEDSDPEVSLHYAFWNDDASQDKEVDKISGEKGSPRLQVKLNTFVLWLVMVIVAMAVTLMLRAFDPMGRSWSMESTANATHVGARNVQTYYTNANEEYHLSNDTSADNSHGGGLSANGTLNVDQDSSEYETSNEGEKAALETSSALGDSDVKPDESDQPDSGVKPGPSATKLPFRDRVDYLLGWKGPTSQSRDEVS